MDCRAAHRSRHPTFILWFLDGSPGRNTQQRAGGLWRNKHICRRTVWSRLQIQTKTMNLSQNFTLEELTYSRIAVENGLENVPPPQALKALKKPCSLPAPTASQPIWQRNSRHERLPQRNGQPACRRSRPFATHQRRSRRLLHPGRPRKTARSTETIRTNFRPGHCLPPQKIPPPFLPRRV